MDIVVKGRNVEVPDHFRVHVADKLERSERYDPKIIRVDVELSHETNRRQSKTCQRVQITLATRGPAVRAEASAETFYAALDAAVTKLETRLRRSADRRHDRQSRAHADRRGGGQLRRDSSARRGERRRRSRSDAAAVGHGPPSHAEYADDGTAAGDGGPGRIVRIKDHPAEPITVDQALFQMELVGHDFYLFNDADTQPRVRRLPAEGLRLRPAAAHLTRVAPGGAGRIRPQPANADRATIGAPTMVTAGAATGTAPRQGVRPHPVALAAGPIDRG